MFWSIWLKSSPSWIVLDAAADGRAFFGSHHHQCLFRPCVILGFAGRSITSSPWYHYAAAAILRHTGGGKLLDPGMILFGLGLTVIRRLIVSSRDSSADRVLAAIRG
jgi:hypothetical protein